jgi:hypothetical protein
MPILGRLIAIIIVCLVAVPAGGQTLSHPSRAFVDVLFAPNWDDMHSHRVSGATWASGLVVGLDAGRSGVELGVSVPQWHVQNRMPERYRYAGQSFGWQQQNHSYEWSSTTRRRSVDVTVLYRFNLPVNRHLTVSWLAGGGYVYRPDQYTVVTKEVLPDGRLIDAHTDTSVSSRNYLAGTARLDFEVRVTQHFSLVPRLRVTAFPALLDDSGSAPRLFVGRPEIAVRWQF